MKKPNANGESFSTETELREAKAQALTADKLAQTAKADARAAKRRFKEARKAFKNAKKAAKKALKHANQTQRRLEDSLKATKKKKPIEKAQRAATGKQKSSDHASAKKAPKKKLTVAAKPTTALPGTMDERTGGQPSPKAAGGSRPAGIKPSGDVAKSEPNDGGA